MTDPVSSSAASGQPDPARVDIAREARALRRNNAQDAIARVLRTEYGLTDQTVVVRISRDVATELAAWFRERSSPSLNGDPFILASEWAARLIEEFTP